MMTTSMKLLAAAGLLASTGLAQAAPISIFSHSINDPTDGSFDGVNTRGGDVKSIRTTYNETEETFAWSYTVAPSPRGRVNDGFWLVVSDGPDPEYDEDEYVILFGDLDSNRLTAYLYSGRNSSDSWRDPGVLLESYDVGTLDIDPGASGSDETTVSFDIDVAGLNSYRPAAGSDGVVRDSAGRPWDADSWDGLAFGESLGIWFHPTTGTRTAYDADGGLTRFSPRRAGYYDGKDIAVKQVPEPGVLYLAGLGLFAFMLSRKLGRPRRRGTRMENYSPVQFASAV